MTDEEMLDRAAELLGSRDYAEVQDKQGLLKKIIEREARFSHVPVSTVIAALEMGFEFDGIRSFFDFARGFKSKKEFLANYLYEQYFSHIIEELFESATILAPRTDQGIRISENESKRLISNKLKHQIEFILDVLNTESLEKILIKDRVTCEDPETGKFYALSSIDSEQVLDENGNLDFSRL